MTEAPPAATVLAEQLARITGDLDGYLERRAAELAAPVIDAHRAETGAVIVELTARVERGDSLFTTCRAVITNLEDRLDELREKYGEPRDVQVAERRRLARRQRDTSSAAVRGRTRPAADPPHRGTPDMITDETRTPRHA